MLTVLFFALLLLIYIYMIGVCSHVTHTIPYIRFTKIPTKNKNLPLLHQILNHVSNCPNKRLCDIRSYNTDAQSIAWSSNFQKRELSHVHVTGACHVIGTRYY